MSTVPRLLVAGLGNLPYPNTRHSLGQLIIDELAWRTGIQLSSDRDGFCGHGQNVSLGETRVDLVLYKSKHLMNISGPSIAAACRSRGIPPHMLVLVSDSTDHDPCKLNCRLGGSPRGHNGIKSVVSALGTPDFHRLRVGVGRHPTMDLAEYVMGRLSSHERQFWNGEGVDLVCEAIGKIARDAKK
ncbi:peptidyl-tRNA hydrolase [Roridomyces roridus]|uniref:peptidyl-tRNA hydrolase n=1 Tax=Roridomyces roridus TaxID=1738132 RepID=A0AAD7C0I8_9AGAR|nr:peptidyl-tRNA hydrolase [Roridomyces roridus]